MLRVHAMDHVDFMSAARQPLTDLLHQDTVPAEIPGWIVSRDMTEAHTCGQYNGSRYRSSFFWNGHAGRKKCGYHDCGNCNSCASMAKTFTILIALVLMAAAGIALLQTGFARKEIPIHEGLFIVDIVHIPLRPWPQLGAGMSGTSISIPAPNPPGCWQSAAFPLS